jgi:SAM-dependent methyltransferase
VSDKLILDCTCGSRSIWFEKNEPHTLYCDRRQEHFEGDFGTVKAHRTIHIEPDMIADFTNLPFDDNTFNMVVFDPPHIIGHNEGWLNKRYGDYSTKEEALESVSKGIAECMRVLKPNGTLIFKWADLSVSTAEILKRIDYKPLFGHRSGKKSNTHWMCFMKFDDRKDGAE